MISDLIKQYTEKDVYLYGIAALYTYILINTIPDKIEYNCCHDIVDDRFVRIQCNSTESVNKFRRLDKSNIFYLTPMCVACKAIHDKDIDTLTECILLFGEKFDCAKLRGLYEKVYSGRVLLPIETYKSTILASNIFMYMRVNRLSYKEFVERLPKLCDELGCSEAELEPRIMTLL